MNDMVFWSGCRDCWVFKWLLSRCISSVAGLKMNLRSLKEMKIFRIFNQKTHLMVLRFLFLGHQKYLVYYTFWKIEWNFLRQSTFFQHLQLFRDLLS